MGNVIFDGRRFSDFGVIVSGENTWAQPTRRVTKAQVPGRHGDLIVEAGEFDNVDISYPAGIMQDFDSYTNGWEQFEQFLAVRSDKYYHLEDEYHPLYYRMARFVPGIAPKVGTLNRSGQFNVTFDCKPQKWLKSGENEIVLTDYTGENGIEMVNSTPFPAYPEIQISAWVGLAFLPADGSKNGGMVIVKPETEPEEEQNVKYTYYTEMGEVVKDYQIAAEGVVFEELTEYATSYTDHLNNGVTIAPHYGMTLAPNSATTIIVFRPFDSQGAYVTRDDIHIRIKPRFYTI